ncbi:MAG TPA: GNAT family N-acetyltransferase [Rubrivivax sp.]
MSIRAATPDDAAAIARVHVDSWAATYAAVFPPKVFDEYPLSARERTWQRTTHAARTRPGHRIEVLVAERAGEILGFVSLGPFRAPAGVAVEATRGELNAIYLAPAHLRQGIGSALFVAGRHWLRSAGFSDMRLWVIEGNPAAHFYRAHGGVLVEEKDFELHGSSVAEQCFLFMLDD